MGFFSDLDETSVASKKKGFFSDLEEQPSRTRSILSAFPKGVAKGLSSVAEGPIAGMIRGNKPSLEETLLERHLPTQKGHATEDILEIAGEMAPGFAIGPGGLGTKLAQLAAGSITKKGLKELGAPELVQDIGAGIGSLGPQAIRGALSKKLLPNAAQKEVYDLLKGYGFNDKAITPYIQNEKKASRLAKYARGFLDPEKFYEETKPVADMVYESIKQKQMKLPPLSGLKKTAFLKHFDDIVSDIPYTYTDLISKDISKLKSSDLTFRNMRDFEAALNRKVGDVQGGKAVLNKLKDSINFGERLISPDLYKEKEIMNRAYKSRMDIYNRLPENVKGNLLEKAGEMGPLGALGLSYIFGSPWVAKGYAIKKGSELAASKMLTSPRFQNMQQKLMKSILEDNKGGMLHIVNKMMDETDKLSSPKKESDKE